MILGPIAPNPKTTDKYVVYKLGTSNKDICLLLEEFVVVTQLMIFPFELLGSAEKPMAGPSSCKGKIMR